MAKITYTNKVTLNEQPSVADINKVTDDDMNEIKNVVNTNDDNVGTLSNLKTTSKTSTVSAINELVDSQVYSTDEVKTNKVWIDGKPIYRKIFEGTANIQQSGSSQPITNLPSDSDTIINLYGYFKWSSYLQTFPIVWGTSSCSLRVVGKSIQYYSNFGIGSGTYIIISEYTKTTD